MEKDESKISFTAQQLREAVTSYESLLKPDVEQAYAAMLQVPEFGVKVVQAMEYTAKLVNKGKMDGKRVLDAAVVPAFLIGMLVGLGGSSSPKPIQVLEFEMAMALLQQAVGRQIIAEVVNYGSAEVLRGVLKEAVPFKTIRTDRWSIPFIGSGCAIRRVFLKEQGQEQTLYANPGIRADYDVRDEAEVQKLRRAMFGVHV